MIRRTLLFGTPRATAAPSGTLTLLAPDNGASQAASGTVFRWQATGRADTYRIQFAPDSEFASITHQKAGLHAPRYAPDGVYLDPELAYYWRVRAENALGVGDWTTTRVLLPYWLPEGYGAIDTTGGTGGAIVPVTNLNNTGAGSLRAALTASGTRIILVTTTGTIALTSRIEINNPNFTLICIHTSGLTVTGYTVEMRGTSGNAYEMNAFVRNIHFRPEADPVSDSDGLLISGHHVVVDHCSAAFGRDENIGVGGAQYITVQWCIAAYGRIENKGFFVANPADYVTGHHNIVAHSHDRNPLVQAGHAEWVNNVIYNGGTPMQLHPAYSPLFANFIGNYFKAGPDTDGDAWINGGINQSLIGAYTVSDASDFWDTSAFYLRGNQSGTRTSDAEDEIDIMGGADQTHPARVLDEIVMTSVSTNATSATAALNAVIGGAGASPRDAIDTQVVSDMQSGTAFVGIAGSFISDPSEVGLTKPAHPLITSPATNGTVLVNDTPTFAWTCQYGDPAPTFTIEISLAADPTFAAPEYSAAGITESPHTVTAPLDRNASYIARVLANNSMGQGISSTRSFSIPAYDAGDDFNRADGATGNGWTGGAIASEKLVITPTLGAEVFPNPTFALWTAGKPNGATVTENTWRDWSEVNSGDLHGASGTGSGNLWRDTVANGETAGSWDTTFSGILTAGLWYVLEAVVSARRVGSFNLINNWIVDRAALIATVKVGGRAANTSFTIRSAVADTDLTFDSVSIKSQTLSTMIAHKDWGAGAELGSLQCNLTSLPYLWSGVIHYTDENNFVALIHDGITNLHLIKRVAGTYTAVTSSVAATYAAGAAIKLVRETNQYDGWYNGTQRISNAVVADAAFATETKWGALSQGDAQFDNALFDFT